MNGVLDGIAVGDKDGSVVFQIQTEHEDVKKVQPFFGAGVTLKVVPSTICTSASQQRGGNCIRIVLEWKHIRRLVEQHASQTQKDAKTLLREVKTLTSTVRTLQTRDQGSEGMN